MNMKRNIIYLAFVALVAACAPEKEISFELDSKEIHVGPEGGVRSIKVDVGVRYRTAMSNMDINGSGGNFLESISKKPATC